MVLFELILMIAAFSLAAYPAEADGPDFERQIRPLLQQHCGRCHGASQQQGGLRLDARHTFFRGGDSGPPAVAGKPESSELLRRLRSTDTADQMPPEGARLSVTEIELFEHWIASGLDWPETAYDREATKDHRLEHWSFQVPRLVDPPTIAAAPADATSIDRFLMQRLESAGLQMNPRADRRTLIRRLSLLLTGLLPEAERVERFINDDSPDAWPKLIEEYLDSPQYGERWAQHWLDVIRYADTHGFEVNTPRENAWPYRDYVIRIQYGFAV